MRKRAAISQMAAVENSGRTRRYHALGSYRLPSASISRIFVYNRVHLIPTAESNSSCECMTSNTSVHKLSPPLQANGAPTAMSGILERTGEPKATQSRKGVFTSSCSVFTCPKPNQKPEIRQCLSNDVQLPSASSGFPWGSWNLHFSKQHHNVTTRHFHQKRTENEVAGS